MPLRRQAEFVFLFSAVAALVFGCAGGPYGVPDNTVSIRQELRKPLAPKAKERLLRPDQLSSIGEVARIDGLEPLPCAGLGVVTGLGENGAEKSNMDSRSLSDIKKALMTEEGRTLDEAKRMVEGRDSSIVQVSGAIPAGAANGDLFDVYVASIDAAVSLDNGYLHLTPLRTYVTIEGEVATGNVIARAGGAVSVGGVFPSAFAASSQEGRAGVVFDGGRAQGERILLIVLGEKNASASRAVLVEYLLNMRFANVNRQPGVPPVDYAVAVSNRIVQLRIPAVYRRYVERFADVVRQMRGSYYYGPPSNQQMEKAAARLASGAPKDKYLASVELEAVGAPAAPYLETAAGSKDDWTALYAAQALSYLESPKGPDRMYSLADSKDEAVRYEAVRFIGQLAGRRAVQALRERIYDPSNRVALEAVKGLVASGEGAASMVRLSRFDIVAVPGAEPGMLVKSSGRPMVIIVAPGTPLKGSIAITMPNIGIGSVDERNVAITTGEGPGAQTIQVEATADNILAVLAQSNPPFEVIRKTITALEDARNIPYKVRYLD